MWKDVIYLGQESESIANFEVIKSWTYRMVFANKRSVRQSEAYQASAIGLKPEIMFEIHSIDFEGEERIKFNNKIFEIIRVYDKGEVTELVCSAISGSEI